MNIDLWNFQFKITQKCFKWVSDPDGDVCLQIFGLFTIVKYKDIAIFRGPFDPTEYRPAERWQGRLNEDE